jgi:rhodanese-related sulfurtransferase
MDPHFDGVIFKTHAAELARRMRMPHPPFLVIDVREPGERSHGVIPGSVALRSVDLSDLPAGATPGTEFFVVGHDQYDEEVRRTTDRLRELGARRVVEFTGGMSEWEGERLPVDRGAGSRAA